jgi:inward rectifier potassium channel
MADHQAEPREGVQEITQSVPTPSSKAPGAPQRRLKMMTRTKAFEVLGVDRSPRLDDLYLKLLARPWRWTIGLIVVFLLLQNLLFAVGYFLCNGVDGTSALRSEFSRAFFFSVETLGTIGYGTLYPTNMTAHLLVTAESITGILSTALITGVIFAKFSRIRVRVIFAKYAVISMVDGVPTLMIRVANERGDHIADANISLTLLRVGQTKEGHALARMIDLKLVRDRSPVFTRTWLVMHKIDETSPLFGLGPNELRDSFGEIVVSFAGVDNVSSQSIHAVDSYLDDEILWGARYVDMMHMNAAGRGRLDMGKFHFTESTESVPEFPHSYPHGPNGEVSLDLS